MRITNLKHFMLAIVIGMIVILGTSEVVVAQDRWEDRRERREDRRERREDRLERQRERWEDRIERRQERRENQRRYRIYQEGRYYQMDYRGVETLRQAVNLGYQQGFHAGVNDRRFRRSYNFYDSLIYRRANYGYRSYVDYNQYQYYFRQGYQRGYEDGFYSRYNYGTNRNGAINIFGSILNGILNVIDDN